MENDIMTPELEKELYDIDPVFFKDAIACKNGEKTEMDTCMYFGCECGDGWFEGLKDMTHKISLLNKAGKEDNIEIICNQLKEKFGTLRVYFQVGPIDKDKDSCNKDYYYDLTQKIIDDTEEQLTYQCEICGKKGTQDNPIVITSGWIQYICFDCAFKDDDKYEIIPCDGIFKFLSMKHDYRFNFNGHCYGTVAEAFYSILKPEYANLIRNMNIYGIFEFADKFIEDKHSDIALHVMEDVLRTKFNNTEMKTLLNKTGDKPIMFINNFHENYWGKCICDDCKHKEKLNHYGDILTKIRDDK